MRDKNSKAIAKSIRIFLGFKIGARDVDKIGSKYTILNLHTQPFEHAEENLCFVRGPEVTDGSVKR